MFESVLQVGNTFESKKERQTQMMKMKFNYYFLNIFYKERA